MVCAMDTTPAVAPTPAVASWWRRPLADLLDVAVVTVSGLLVGGAVAAVFLADAGDDPWAGLGAALLGLGAGLAAALAVWIGLLVRMHGRGTSPGSRALGLVATGVVAAAGRHVAVVVVLWAGLGTAAAAVEPWPVGPLGGAAAAAVATGAALAAWGRGPWRARLRIVGVAAVAGLLVTGAFPDRAPYPWELRAEAETAVRAALAGDPGARRACDLAAGGAPDGPLASHATEVCYDPDREWLVDRHPAVVADRLAAVAHEAGGAHTTVRHATDGDHREVRVGDVVVAHVLPRDGCASRVVVSSWVTPSPPEHEAVVCR